MTSIPKNDGLAVLEIIARGEHALDEGRMVSRTEAKRRMTRKFGAMHGEKLFQSRLLEKRNPADQ